MTLCLTNTVTRTKDAVTPLNPDHVTMYVCGPTVYNFAHIGNARPAVVFDVAERYIKAHHEDMAVLGVLTPDLEPRAMFEGRKMSKSLGNVLLVRDLLHEAPGEAIRFALLGTQYRQPLDWNTEGLAQAKPGLDRLYGVPNDLSDAPAWQKIG